MDGITAASRAIQLVELSTRLTLSINKITGAIKAQEIHHLPGIADQLQRLSVQSTLFQAVTSDIVESLSEDVDPAMGSAIHSTQRRLSEVHGILSDLGSKKVQPLFETKIKQKLEKGIDGLAEDVRFLCDLHHTFTLRDLRERLHKMTIMSQEAAKFSLESSRVQFDEINQRLATLRSDLAGALNLPNSPDIEDETSKRRQEDLEEMRQGLYERLSSLNQPSLVFPFNLVSQGSDASKELLTRRVKLDTGARDNWIQSSVLKCWGVQYESMEDSETYVGAGGGQFKALGQVKLLWYSINKAKTKVSDFLVHNELPFDAILGSRYIMAEPMDTFAEGVLPLMHIIPKDELGRLQDTMTARGASSEEVKKIQRARKAQERDESRQLKAASRAATRIGTPGLATPTGGLLYSTMSRAGTSRTTLLSSTLLSGSTPQRSGIATPAATADPSVHDPSSIHES